MEESKSTYCLKKFSNTESDRKEKIIYLPLLLPHHLTIPKYVNLDLELWEW